ncbi:hypothetical protein NL108_007290 [Boleophthalmus pectinirostris]|nr:hypothetical protein NL108_007290 [Boleophthalmus pectinirostris]
MSRKSWLKMVPTENCDILMTFPDSIDDHTLLWLLNQIRVGVPQVNIQVRQHKHTQANAFFITTSFENLLRGAEQMGMHKAVKPQFGGGMRRFSCDEDNIYENIDSELCFFTSQERQSIIKYWLDNLRAKQGEVLHNINFLEGQPIIPELVARGVIHQMFPLHEQRILNQLMTSWVQAVCERQPLDDICDYFGVKISMYFAWLGFYTNSMLYPAVIGFLLWILAEADQTSQDICCVVFALFNVVWATLFLERWKRREAELAYRWGTLDTPAESLEEPRPQFRGVKRCSPITGCEEFYYPPWKRALFQWLVSLPVCLLCLCFVFLAMLLCLELQEVVMEIQELPSITRFIPKILLAITVTICDEVYKKIAYWLNDMENYRLQSAYENNLIIKMVFFEFINSYLSLFYIAFYLKDMERLKEMLATLLIFRQFLQNIKEVLQPYLYEQNKLGVFTPKVLWELLQAIGLKYGRLVLGKAQASITAYSFLGPRGISVNHSEAPKRRGDLKAGFRLSEEEWDLTENALKNRKVSFTERVDYQSARAEGRGAEDEPREDSPTLGDEVMDAACMSDSCDDDSDGEAAAQETKENATASKGSDPVCHKRKNTADKGEKKSWMDPPEEPKTVTLTQAEIESCMQTYEDTLQDYQEMFIQFGYVVLFSSAFPLAAMCALVNNIIEIRSDALKLCTGLQRPFGQRVENIGQWQTAMEAMGLIAIIVNCYLIGQCGQLQRLFPWLSPEMTIISIVLLEHFAILLKYVIHVAIPDIPGWVADEMAKLEYRRREAFKKHELQAQQHFQQQLRRRREEEELQRQAELQAEARAHDPDCPRNDSSHPHHHDKSTGGKSGDKPKRPSSLLGNNNVMKLKQIIPLQGKFSSSGSKSPAQSPTGGEAKLPGFLKFLKSPEVKKEPAVASSTATATGACPSSSSSSTFPSSSQERSQSPNRTFSPGKLFSFSKSEGSVVCANGGAQGQGQTQEELPSNESDRGADTDSTGTKS